MSKEWADFRKQWEDEKQLERLKSLVENLNAFRKEGTHTDIIFVVDGKEFHCHKAVLAAASPYFNAMFNSGMKESVQSSIQLNGLQPETFELLLEYAYNGKLDLPDDDVEELIVASDLFQFEKLKADCENALLDKAVNDEENSLRYLLFGLTYNLKELLRFQWRYAAQGFSSYAETCSDEILQSLDVETLIKLIKMHSLQVRYEDDVYKFVKRWMNVDVEKNGPSFERVLPHIRLAFCTKNFLKDEVSKDMKLANKACQKLLKKQLKEAKEFQMVHEKHQHEIVTPVSQHREDYEMNRILFTIGGSGKSENNLHPYEKVFYAKACHPVHEYCWFLNVINLVATHCVDNEAIYESAVCFNKGVNVLLIGGILSNREPVDTCTAVWLDDGEPSQTVRRIFGKMSQGRHLHSAVLIDTDVYIFGGRTNTGVTNKAERLELVKSNGLYHGCTSEPLNDMPVAAWSTMSVLFDNKVYILGGSSDPGILSTNQVFNTKRRHQTWTLKASMPTACCDAAAVRYNDNIFVVGGRERVCMSYTPRTDSWSTLKGPEQQHGFAPAVVFCGKIVVGGGLVDRPASDPVAGSEPWAEPNNVSANLDISDKVEEYDPVTNSWTQWDMGLPDKVFRHHFFNLPCKND